MTFDNCIISSDFFPAIGIGLFDNKTLEIRNCTLISNQDTYGTYINDGTLGALYFHNRAGTLHYNQKIIVDNCKLKSKKENVLCPFDVPGDTGVSELEYEFTNNVLYSEINGYTNNIWWRNGQINFTKSPLSFGNSNPSLNAS